MNRRINHVCFMGVSLLFAIGMAMILAGKDGRRTASTGAPPVPQPPRPDQSSPRDTAKLPDSAPAPRDREINSRVTAAATGTPSAREGSPSQSAAAILDRAIRRDLGTAGQVEERQVQAEANDKPRPLQFEAESLRVETSGGFRYEVQTMEYWGAARWSGGRQIWASGGQSGDEVILTVPALPHGTYRLDLCITRAPDYGKVQVLIDNRPLGEPYDGYGETVKPGGPIAVGVVHLAPTTHKLALRAVGKNPLSTDYMIGIDRVDFVPFVRKMPGHSPASNVAEAPDRAQGMSDPTHKEIPQTAVPVVIKPNRGNSGDNPAYLRFKTQAAAAARQQALNNARYQSERAVRQLQNQMLQNHPYMYQPGNY